MKTLALVIVLFCLCGCQMVKNLGRQIASSTTGISRNITLYSVDGKILKTWFTKSSINDEGAVVCFYDDKGMAVQISGTIIVQQVD